MHIATQLYEWIAKRILHNSARLSEHRAGSLVNKGLQSSDFLSPLNWPLFFRKNQTDRFHQFFNLRFNIG